MKSRIKNYLSLTKKEWNGMVVLVILMALILAFPYVYQLLRKDSTINTRDFDKAVAQLQKTNTGSANGKTEKTADTAVKTYPVKLKPGTSIELNTADSAKLTQVHGVGPSFAMRIIRYRGRLGGFYQKEQLKEIYGLDSAKYNEINSQLSLNPSTVSRLKINSISFVALREFPYLTYKQASAVIEYRVQHGKYNGIADVEKIAILSPADLQKIKPYLSFK